MQQPDQEAVQEADGGRREQRHHDRPGKAGVGAPGYAEQQSAGQRDDSRNRQIDAATHQHQRLSHRGDGEEGGERNDRHDVGQTLAVYRLLDELRAAHPGVEIESCASGGGRVDLAILERTDRVWTSDCNDALERQAIQRGLSMLLPPELMGAHVGPATSHTTGRRHTLAFRGATALFGHLGVEWDLLRLDDDEIAALAGIIDIHRRHRHLLHEGEFVRFDHPGTEALAHGVYATDRTEAIVAYVQLTTAPALAPAPLRLPGLDPDRRYRVAPIPLPGGRTSPLGRGRLWLDDGLVLSGRQLAAHGVQLPVMTPESALLLHLRATADAGGRR